MIAPLTHLYFCGYLYRVVLSAVLIYKNTMQCGPLALYQAYEQYIIFLAVMLMMNKIHKENYSNTTIYSSEYIIYQCIHL